MIPTLNAFSSRVPTSTSLSASLGFYLAPLFWTYSSVSPFCLICIFNPMCLVGWLHLPILEEWPFVGDIPCISAVHSPLVTRAICSRDALYVRHGLIGLGSLRSDCLPGAALCGVCQSLMSAVGSWYCWLCVPEGFLSLFLLWIGPAGFLTLFLLWIGASLRIPDLA